MRTFIAPDPGYEPVETTLEVLRECGHVTGLAFHPDVDLEVLERLLQPDEVAPPADPGQLARSVGSCSFVLGMRLHSLILAAAASRPFVGVAYHPKVSEFVRWLGVGRVLDLEGYEDGGGRALTRMVRDTMEAKDELVEEIRSAVGRRRREGVGSFDEALGALPFDHRSVEKTTP